MRGGAGGVVGATGRLEDGDGGGVYRRTGSAT